MGDKSALDNSRRAVDFHQNARHRPAHSARRAVRRHDDCVRAVHRGRQLGRAHAVHSARFSCDVFGLSEARRKLAFLHLAHGENGLVMRTNPVFADGDCDVFGGNFRGKYAVFGRTFRHGMERSCAKIRGAFPE